MQLYTVIGLTSGAVPRRYVHAVVGRSAQDALRAADGLCADELSESLSMAAVFCGFRKPLWPHAVRMDGGRPSGPALRADGPRAFTVVARHPAGQLVALHARGDTARECDVDLRGSGYVVVAVLAGEGEPVALRQPDVTRGEPA